MNIENMNLSFAGCGFLCIYHAGVAAAIKEYAPQLTRNRVSGASAGAVVAAGLLCNVSISEATSTILKVVCQARAGTLQALSPTFDLMGLLREGLDRTLPANAHTICSGHLFISLTRARDYKNVVVCEFESREELIQAIICSCFIPFYCGRDPPKYRGVAYIDGGCSDNQPIYDKSTITVSPFSGESDICPTDIDSASLLGFYFAGTSIRFTTQNLFRLMVVLFPPAQDICSKICRQGFEDALRFLTKNGITPCIRCLTIQSDALPVPQHDHALPSLRHRNRSFGNRRRLDSECGKCFSSLDSSHSLPTMTTTLFPEIMQQTLEQAQVTESRLYRNLQYIASFRLVQWSLKLMTPVTLPLEFLLLTLKTFKEWIASSSKTDFFVQRLQAIVDFILAELEKQRILYNPLVSVPMAISYATSAYPSSPRANAKATVSHMDAGHRHDRRSNAPVDVHMEYDVDDDDSMAQLVDYSTQHDAVLEFYYTNEKTNQVEVCEIFDMRNPRLARNQPGARQRRARAAAASSALMEQDEREANSEPSTSGVFSEENSANAERRHLAKVESPVPGEDSGLSLTEDSSNGLTVKKRDACCSPVRHFGPTRAIQRTNSQRSSASSSSRRHTLAGSRRTPSSSLHSLHSTKSAGQQSSGASSSKHRPNPLSSDSDADAGEAFFVSNPRKRTSSGEYDGEPESSDQ